VYAQFNIYRSMMAGLADPGDFDALVAGLARILGSVPRAEATLLPYALHQASCVPEVLVLLWKALDENPGFLEHVLTETDVTAVRRECRRRAAADLVVLRVWATAHRPHSQRRPRRIAASLRLLSLVDHLILGRPLAPHPPAALQIVTPVLYQMWTGRSNVTRVGLIHLCTFLLLLLSGNRAFGVGLNKLFSGNLPADFPAFEGSHADLLVLVLHKLIVDGSPKLSTLYSCFLTVIANVSSYTKVRHRRRRRGSRRVYYPEAFIHVRGRRPSFARPRSLSGVTRSFPRTAAPLLTPHAQALSLASSTKLLTLFELFASPRFLFARPGNVAFAGQLLEALNNLVQYQYESNAVLGALRLRRRRCGREGEEARD
jgi:hypothetical protein